MAQYAAHLNLLELVDGAPFPASKTELVLYAQDNGASDFALDMLRAMPDVIYRGIQHFSNNVGFLEMLAGDANELNIAPYEDPQQQGSPQAGPSLPDGTDRIISP